MSSSDTPVGTTLVVVEANAARKAPSPRSEAAFLTHLLAVRDGVPQARARRRIEPDAGAAAYRSSSHLCEVVVTHRAISRKA